MASDELPSTVKGGALVLIGAVLGAGGVYLAAPEPPLAQMEHDHAMHAHDGGTNPQGNLWELPAGAPVPSVEFAVSADTHGGWNLKLTTQNFTFGPDDGHAHLYANGDKIARIYGDWFHIGALPDGEVELTVTLNTSDHKTMASGGAAIEARQIITNN